MAAYSEPLPPPPSLVATGKPRSSNYAAAAPNRATKPTANSSNSQCSVLPGTTAAKPLYAGRQHTAVSPVGTDGVRQQSPAAQVYSNGRLQSSEMFGNLAASTRSASGRQQTGSPEAAAAPTSVGRRTPPVGGGRQAANTPKRDSPATIAAKEAPGESH